jgi:hypothetical protein
VAQPGLTAAPAAVQALIDWAQRGPDLARVDAVVVSAVEAGDALAGFEPCATL